MTDPQESDLLTREYPQLTQVRVPIRDAAQVFANVDASGYIPIVLVPASPNRIRNSFLAAAGIVFVASIVVSVLFNFGAAFTLLSIAVAVALVVFAVMRAFLLRVPEGTSALLSRGGKYIRTVGPGINYVLPWIVVSHLVNRREIPYDAPVQEAITADNILASVKSSITFAITDPYHFVYGISTVGFDQVFQALCQDKLRAMVRPITSDHVADLAKCEATDLREALNAEVEQYGVTVRKVFITDARPPAELLRSQAARQLAVVERSEQEQRQALAQRRQADAELLALQGVRSRVELARTELQAELERAELRRKLTEIVTATELARRAVTEEGLANYPLAAQLDVLLAQLEVAKALAGNTRALVQIGTADDIIRSFMMRDMLTQPAAVASNGAPSHDQETLPQRERERV